MLPTLIQRCYKIISFLIQLKNDWLKFYRLLDATFYYRITTIYQFIKPFLDKMSIFEEYGAFETCWKNKKILVSETLHNIKQKIPQWKYRLGTVNNKLLGSLN